MKSRIINIPARDGKDIKTKICEVQDPKAVVIIGYGFGEYLDMYDIFVEELVKANYVCIIFDQRGHGEECHRTKNCGVIPSYESFLDDLETVKDKAKVLYPNKPIFLYGHSMGGNIVISYLLKKGQSDITGAILEAPWLRLAKPMPKLVVGVAKILGRISGKIAIIQKLKRHEVVRVVKEGPQIEDYPFYHNRISFRLFTGINEAAERAIANADKITIPTVLMNAGSDKIVSTASIEEFMKKANDNVILKTYEDGYHALHGDIIKDEYTADVIKYLDEMWK